MRVWFFLSKINSSPLAAADRNTGSPSHTDERAHHYAALLPPLRPVRTCIIMQTTYHVTDGTRRNVPLNSRKAEPVCQIEIALVCPARWPLHADGLPLRPIRGKARCSTGTDGGGGGAAPGTSTVRVTRFALRERSRRFVHPLILFAPKKPDEIELRTRHIRINVLPARSGAR